MQNEIAPKSFRFLLNQGLVHTRIWRRNKSALFQDFLLVSSVLRVRGRFQNPRQTPVRAKLRLKRFPKVSNSKTNWSTTSRGLRNAGFKQIRWHRKKKAFFSAFLDFSEACSSTKGRKQPDTPKPPFVTPPFAAAQTKLGTKNAQKRR